MTMNEDLKNVDKLRYIRKSKDELIQYILVQSTKRKYTKGKF